MNEEKVISESQFYYIYFICKADRGGGGGRHILPLTDILSKKTKVVKYLQIISSRVHL